MSSSFSAKDIKDLESALLTASLLLKSEIKYEDTYVFIGASGSGKSSLMNWAIGNKLVGKKDADFRRINLEKGDDSPGPKIGIGATAETTIPARWNSKRFLHKVLWDLPGFVDNRGVIQDITNAYYVFELFTNIKSAKVVIVIDINDIIASNINPVLSLLRSLEDIFGESMNKCFHSIAVIFTKVPEMIGDGPADKDCINDFLKGQFLKNNKITISEPGKNLISYLINNNQNIGLYKKVPVGPVSDKYIDVGITDAINNIKSVPEEILKEVSPSISEQSKLALFNAREELCCKKAMVELQHRIETYFKEKLTAIQRIRKERSIPRERYLTLNDEFCIIENQINTFLNLPSSQDKLCFIKFIDPSFDKLIDDHNLIERIKLMKFVDRMFNIEESSLYDLGLREIMLNAQNKVHEVIMWIKGQLIEISVERATEEVSKMNKAYLKEIEDLQHQFEKANKNNYNLIKLVRTLGNTLHCGFQLIVSCILKSWEYLFQQRKKTF